MPNLLGDMTVTSTLADRQKEGLSDVEREALELSKVSADERERLLKPLREQAQVSLDALAKLRTLRDYLTSFYGVRIDKIQE